MNHFKILFLAVFFTFVSSSLLNGQWVLQNNPYYLEGYVLGKIQYVTANEGWVSAGNGKLLHTTNGGTNWLIVSPEPVDTLFSWSDPALSISFINPSNGWIIRTKISGSNWSGARVYKTTNGGVNWTKLTIPTYDAGLYIQFVDANNGWILVFNSGFTGGGLFRTSNGGANWNMIIPPVGGIPFFVNANTGWLMPTGGESGITSDTIRKTTNGGVNWFAPFGTNNLVRYRTIYFSDVNYGWAVGDNALVKKTTNGGITWENVPIFGYPIGGTSKAVFFLNSTTGWIGVKNDTITNNVYVFYTNNGGTSWQIQSPPVQNNSIFSIHFYDANNGGLIADSEIICRTNNGGVGIINTSKEIPLSYSLYQNYPNPFNPSTTIKFDLPKSSFVKLAVYDILGKEVEVLVNEQLTAGTYGVKFDGSKLQSGIYFYKLKSENYTTSKKLIILK